MANEIELDEHELQQLKETLSKPDISTPVLEGERILFIVGEISQSTFANFVPAFCMIDQSNGPITIKICSEGGDLEASFGIFDIIRNARNSVIIEGFGVIASAAALILQAGSKRLLGPNTTFMIHSSSSAVAVPASAEEFISLGQQMDRLNKLYCQILSERSKYTFKQIRELCTGDAFFSAKEAIKAGFADGLIKTKRKSRK